MRDDEFEWDDRKARSNLKKHGVDFADACGVFDDERAVDRDDDTMDYGEDRFRCTGQVGDVLLTVSYTLRGERRRIISARPASRRENDEYYRS